MPALASDSGSTPTAGHYVPELDGLRALAVLTVVLHHIFLTWGQVMTPIERLSNYTWAGVDVFFVLSGYLITGILLRAKPTTASLKNFYIKRALRIWPLYFALLGVVCLETRFVFHQAYPWAVSLVLMQNFLHAWPNYGFNQTWSLCIEEHFYLVWPLLVFFAPRRSLSWILGLVLVGSPLLRYWAVNHGVSQKLIYTSTQYHLDAMAVGSLIALVFFHGWMTRQQAARVATFVTPVLVILIIADLYNIADLRLHSPALYSLIAFASAGLLVIVVSPDKGWLHTTLSSPPLRYVGKVSYGLYMLHPFVFGLMAHAAVRASLAIPMALGLSFGAAAFSWHFVESRLLKLKPRSDDAPQERFAESTKGEMPGRVLN